MYRSLKMRPGINVEQTPLLNEAGFSFCAAARFRDGLPEKLGGWQHINPQPLIGICRGMHAWADLSGNPYIACGTEQRLELFFGGTLYDITPIRQTDNPAVNFSTVINTNVVTINDPGNGGVAADWVNIVVPVSVGGLILQGFYQIATVIDANNYTILAATNATATVNNGGAVPSFTTVMASPNVTVAFNNHGLVVGNPFTVQVPTSVGGFALTGLYTVAAVPNANSFTIQPGGTASSGATVAENGGNARIEYLIHTGLVSTVPAGGVGGYGVGQYGAGPYGVSSALAPTELRQWFLDNFGQDLIGNYNGSPLYVWTPPAGSGPAVSIDTTNFPGALEPPKQVNVSFVSAPQQMVIALGCDDPVSTNYEPLLVRWCDVGDFTDWQPTSTNEAGSYLIPSGSELVGGISAPNFTVIWTDVDMWLMSYLGGQGSTGAELVWGFGKIGDISLLAPRACAVYKNVVYWIASNGFFSFDGNVIAQIPCPVWDKLWRNLNRTQVNKVNAQVNSYFQEISWGFPSASGSGEVDSRVTFNIREGSWTYDDAPTPTARTAWIDENVYGSPIGTDINSNMQQHDIEGVNDNDGAPLFSSVQTGWFSVEEGTLFAMLERIEGDFIVSGGTETVLITVYAQTYANGPITQYGPYSWTPGDSPPMQSIVRARGRFMSIQVSSSGRSVFWRLGNLRYYTMPAGRR
jgi:hypothetical protein